MTPKEKAKELVNKFYIPIAKRNYPDVAQIQVAKECALIAMNEIIPIIEGYEDALSLSQQSDTLEWWQQVKQETEKL